MNAMRTLTLDEGAATKLESLAARRGITVSALVNELVGSYAHAEHAPVPAAVPANSPLYDGEDWPDWMDPDAIEAVESGLTTVARLQARREAWQRQAEAPLTEEQAEERAAWARIREAAGVELLRRGE